MMASTVADNVSTWRAPLSVNPSRNRLCLRARAPMMASASRYLRFKLSFRDLVVPRPHHHSLRAPRRHDRRRPRRQTRRRILPRRPLIATPDRPVRLPAAAILDITILPNPRGPRYAPATSHFRFPCPLQNAGSPSNSAVRESPDNVIVLTGGRLVPPSWVLLLPVLCPWFRGSTGCSADAA